MKLIATSPAHDAGTVQVQVMAAGGLTADTAADDYTYVELPVENQQPKSTVKRSLFSFSAAGAKRSAPQGITVTLSGEAPTSDA